MKPSILFALFAASMHFCENLRFDAILTPKSLTHWTLMSLTRAFRNRISYFFFQLKGHLPYIRPSWNFVQIFFEALPIFVSENRVTNFCVVCKITYVIIESNIHIVDVNNEEHWAKNRALRDVTSDRRPLWVKSSITTLCCLLLNQFAIHWFTWPSIPICFIL